VSGSALANLKSGGRRWPIHLTLLVLSVIWILPVLGVTITSLRRPADISATGWWTVLQDPRLTLDNYANVINSLGFGKAFLNSILITVPSTVLPIAIGSLAAFAFAWLRFWGRRTLFLIVVALMVLPVQAGFVPILQMFSALGLNRWYVGIWLAHTAFALPFAIFLLRGFFVQLPRELLESAQIDGASRLRTFWQIVIPLSRPALASGRVPVPVGLERAADEPHLRLQRRPAAPHSAHGSAALHLWAAIRHPERLCGAAHDRAAAGVPGLAAVLRPGHRGGCREVTARARNDEP